MNKEKILYMFKLVWWHMKRAYQGLARVCQIIYVHAYNFLAPRIARMSPRQNMSVGLIIGSIMTCGVWYGVLHFNGWGKDTDEGETVTITEVTANGPCGPTCQEKIRNRRARIVPIERNEVKYVLARYNEEYASSRVWRERAKNCLEHWDKFKIAERYTLYPAELLMGKAFMEAMGCQFIGATNGDGGIGPMQITSPEKKHLVATARMLGISVKELRYRENSNVGYFHNVLLGAVMLSDYEEQFNSRGVGILAYNHGPGNVRKAMRKAHLRSRAGRVISDFRGAIPERAGPGGRPSIYVDRILASAVMVDRAAEGKSLLPLTSMSINDIPGHDPGEDGADILPDFLERVTRNP